MNSCRRCHVFENEKLEEYIQIYINRLDEEKKCDKALYKKRLEQCENCSKLVNGMCGICGCFVLIRAAKKDMQCPYPYDNKWYLDNNLIHNL